MISSGKWQATLITGPVDPWIVRTQQALFPFDAAIGEDGPMTIWAVSAGLLVVVMLSIFAVIMLGRQLRLRRYRRNPLSAMKLLSRRRGPSSKHRGSSP